MKLVIGTDEAGYGPNLGPLTVSGTAWLISPHDESKSANGFIDLFDVFDRFFSRCSEPADDRIQVGDSKMIYQSGNGLGGLERLVMKLVGRPDSWKQLLADLGVSEPPDSSSSLPWYQAFNPALPLENAGLTDDLDEVATNKGSRPIAQKSALLEPRPFNAGCDRLGNKASLLSHTTLDIVRQLVESALGTEKGAEIDSVSVFCDKHGGRSKYAAILQEIFPESWVRVICEGREVSRYEFDWKPVPVEIEFQARGESHLPVAAASMISKYLREVSMQAFNAFWQERIPNLSPTAGYPVDAKRFYKEISPEAKELGLREYDWWRNK